MPTKSELVPNKSLRGDELAQIIEADVREVLANDCMLTSRVAYARISYEVRITLQMDNPAFPKSTSVIESHQRSKQEVAAEPSLAAIEPAPPLAPICNHCRLPQSEHLGAFCPVEVPPGESPQQWSPVGLSDESHTHSIERSRTIDSPNVARIEHGLPITVIRQGRDTGGNPISTEEGVVYPASVLEDVASALPVDTDLTRMAKQAFSEGRKF